ncbi:acid phosphatase/vanadium-dependent haloperoxidase related [hydrothermal vent metagenome]|uniref:Acid phosphatase/vanadium-dependent haloperoxidase related n=1 Tax=hydrothermal vent metagenome TaxID=652676 RepID=A0A3B0W1Z3_9ZZZZ
MDMAYLVMPFVAWLVAGCSKFAINSIRAKQWAFGLIGYGGFPSNHSAIVSSMAALIAFKEGVEHPAFGVALALAFIVLLDANSLRRQIGKQAEAINRLQQSQDVKPLRERIGHTKIELLGGIAVGILTAYFIFSVF